MSRGVLLFAHNNENINYGLMALAQARRINRFLQIPTSLVTDSQTAASLTDLVPNWQDSFDQVILQESTAVQTKRYVDQQLTFHNLDRVDAYDLSPYSDTVVIDTDVIIQTDYLNRIWAMPEDLVVCDRSTNLWHQTDPEFVKISDRSVKFYWATVFRFRKTQSTKMFFDYCRHLKQHYSWIRFVHELMSGPVRNDFIWSIALHDLDYPAAVIPYNLMHSNTQDKIVKVANSAVIMLTQNGLIKVTGDLHVFNKTDLMTHVKEELGL